MVTLHIFLLLGMLASFCLTKKGIALDKKIRIIMIILIILTILGFPNNIYLIVRVNKKYNLWQKVDKHDSDKHKAYKKYATTTKKFCIFNVMLNLLMVFFAIVLAVQLFAKRQIKTPTKVMIS